MSGSEDSFLNIILQEERQGETITKGHDSFYAKFVNQGRLLDARHCTHSSDRLLASAQYSDPAITGYVSPFRTLAALLLLISKYEPGHMHSASCTQSIPL